VIRNASTDPDDKDGGDEDEDGSARNPLRTGSQRCDTVDMFGRSRRGRFSPFVPVGAQALHG